MDREALIEAMADAIGRYNEQSRGYNIILAREALDAIEAAGGYAPEGFFEPFENIAERWKQSYGVGSEYSLAYADALQHAGGELSELIRALRTQKG